MLTSTRPVNRSSSVRKHQQTIRDKGGQLPAVLIVYRPFMAQSELKEKLNVWRLEGSNNVAVLKNPTSSLKIGRPRPLAHMVWFVFGL